MTVLVVSDVDHEIEGFGGREAFSRSVFLAVSQSCAESKRSVFKFDANFASGIALIKRLVESRKNAVACPVTIFFDGSNYLFWFAILSITGRLIPAKVVILFHNCEYLFFWQRFRLHPSLKSLMVFVYHMISEFLALCVADKAWFLSQLDKDYSSRLKIINDSSTIVSPAFLTDSSFSGQLDRSANQFDLNPGFALFVGGAFFANVEAVQFLLSEFRKNQSIELVVVGNGMDEAFRDERLPSGVKIFGRVPDLTYFFDNCSFLLAPLSYGSGNKIKVIDSLMRGVPIIGTENTFAGMEGLCDFDGILVTERSNIQEWMRAPFYKELIRYPILRKYFENKHSVDSQNDVFEFLL